MKKFNKTIKLLLTASAMVLALFFCIDASAQVAEKKEAVKETATKDAVKKDDKKIDADSTGWRTKDFHPYVKAINELEKLNEDFSKNLFKLAQDEYSTGKDILEDMENEISRFQLQNKSKKNLNERWYWQETDRKNQEQRYIAKKKQEAKMKAVTYFTKSINFLDEIQSVDMRRNTQFVSFQSRLYQVYVSTNYDLNNFKPCIPILERYLNLNEISKKDEWAYKYLASCYGYMEAVLTKYKHATEDEIMQYRNKKNRSMLQAVELKYGQDSPHFKQLQEIVEQDEKKSERITDNNKK